MNLQAVAVLLLCLATIVIGKYICSDGNCHECIEDTCHLTCQGSDCNNCPNGDCCNGVNCNVCLSSICCTTTKCTECVNENRELCDTEASSETCNKAIGDKCGLQFNKQIPRNTNHNRKSYNVTTIIRIRNLINNTQAINSPIRLNLTNAYSTSVNGTANSYIRKRKKCCSIIHPQECHTIASIPRKICFTRRHIECSELCGNSTNLLVTTSSNKSKCIVIAAHPYYYCGYYSLEDCSSCYHCHGKAKIDCLEEPTCSNTCRSSILPKKFYNVPYYIEGTPGDSTPSNTTDSPTPEPER